ncbi:MAG: hypothetical protein L0Y54_18125 [Sporichthyaceae bacterium]|nr:hypothetical protein [Sporichthyaceae bacterium]
MRLSRRVYPLAGLGLALALALTACGNDGGSSSAPPVAGLDAAQVLAKVGENTTKVESYSFNMEMTSTGDAPLTMKGHGLVQSDPLAMDLEYTDFTAGGQSMSGIQMRLIGDVFYMKIPALSSMIAPAEWVMLDLSSLDGLGGMGFEDLLEQAQQNDPMTQLKALLASEDFTEVGTEQIDGVQTTHYSGSIEVSRIADLAELDADLREQMEQGYQTLGVEKIDYELWLDGDFFTRKMIMTMPGSSGTQTITMTVKDYNQPVEIEAPAESETVDFADVLGG